MGPIPDEVQAAMGEAKHAEVRHGHAHTLSKDLRCWSNGCLCVSPWAVLAVRLMLASVFLPRSHFMPDLLRPSRSLHALAVTSCPIWGLQLQVKGLTASRSLHAVTSCPRSLHARSGGDIDAGTLWQWVMTQGSKPPLGEGCPLDLVPSPLLCSLIGPENLQAPLVVTWGSRPPPGEGYLLALFPGGKAEEAVRLADRAKELQVRCAARPAGC